MFLSFLGNPLLVCEVTGSSLLLKVFCVCVCLPPFVMVCGLSVYKVRGKLKSTFGKITHGLN